MVKNELLDKDKMISYLEILKDLQRDEDYLSYTIHDKAINQNRMERERSEHQRRIIGIAG